MNIRYQQATSLIFKVRGKPQSPETSTIADLDNRGEINEKKNAVDKEIAQ